MRTAVQSIFAVLLACIAAPAHAQGGEVFRTVRIADARPITIGEPIRADVRALLEPAGRGEFHARRGTFTGATAIHVSTRPDGKVRCVAFIYGPEFNFAEAVAEYSRTLGPPGINEPLGRSRRFASWSDGRTALSLMRDSQHTESMLCEVEYDTTQHKPAATIGPVRVAPSRP